MELWHGSSQIIASPCFDIGRPRNDYGRGFYTTPYRELAKEWACQKKGRDGFANHYELDLERLTVLNLEDSEYSVLHWIALLLQHRVFQISSGVEAKGKEELVKRFGINAEDYDVIIGYRADDSYFSYASRFLSNTISVRQLSQAMRLGKLVTQVVLKSAAAFERLTYVGYENAPSHPYYAMRLARDIEAREGFRRLTSTFDRDGVYLADILRGGIPDDDPRLF